MIMIVMLVILMFFCVLLNSMLYFVIFIGCDRMCDEILVISGMLLRFGILNVLMLLIVLLVYRCMQVGLFDSCYLVCVGVCVKLVFVLLFVVRCGVQNFFVLLNDFCDYEFVMMKLVVLCVLSRFIGMIVFFVMFLFCRNRIWWFVGMLSRLCRLVSVVLWIDMNFLL